MGKLCDSCKRQGRVWCPHNTVFEIRQKLMPSMKKEMFGPTPNVFAGHNFYPNVYFGPLVSAQACEDEPSRMYGMTLSQIIESRASLVRGMSRMNVKSGGRILEEAQAAAMSIKPVDVEARFTKTPSFAMEFDDVAHPVGASAPIEKFRLAENASIPKKVDEFYNSDVLAKEALTELLVSGFDVHYLTKLLTSGILGKQENRKLVPTKWAITATDDMAAKRFMESVREYRQIEGPRVYSNTYLDNHFEILLLPGNWEYEQFEVALTKEIEERKRKMQGAHEAAGENAPAEMRYALSAWADWVKDGRINLSEEHEPYFGRGDYAERQGGGYYAARFAVCEALYRMNRQARAIVFREIGTGYIVSVGVWEVRMGVQKAFLNPPEKFSSVAEAFTHLSGKLCVPLSVYVKNSKVLAQRRLTEF